MLHNKTLYGGASHVSQRIQFDWRFKKEARRVGAHHHLNAQGAYLNQISKALKKVRRLAVLGLLPDEYSLRVLAITGDTPASVLPKWKRQAQAVEVPVTVPSEVDISTWDAADWQRWYAANHGSLATALG